MSITDDTAPDVAPVTDAPPDSSINALIARAIDRGVPVDTMERLLVMRTQLKAEAAKEAYFEALAALQAELPIVAKTQAVDYGQGRARYHYAPFDEIIRVVQPYLFKHGFSVTLSERRDESGPYAVATAHHVEGHSESSDFPITVDSSARMNVAQQQASARTYAKRYAYCNVLGIVTGDEDDDAHSSGDAKDTKRPVTPTTLTMKPAQQQPPAAQQPKVVSAPTQRPNKPITDKQLNRLCAIFHAAHHTEDEVDMWLNYRYGFTSKKDIPMNVYDEVCNRLADRTPLNEPEPPPPSDEDFPANWNE